MGWLIAFGVIALLLVIPLFGVDSRDGLDWRPRQWPCGDRRRGPERAGSSLSPRSRSAPDLAQPQVSLDTRSHR
ncbi:MAG: hypothetical protein JWO62_2709 [Acidimicrobiaceae bacterium]|jgi:hypothetical protein|nr:hypothetical protein [Acidimicrobiaceae bacterium]